MYDVMMTAALCLSMAASAAVLLAALVVIGKGVRR